MADIRQILATIGKVAANVVLGTFLPGSTGIIQTVENLLGPNTGAEKKKLAAGLATQILETLAKAGKLDGAAPVLTEVEKIVQATVEAMKAAGTLEETGTMQVGGLGYSIVVIGKLPV